MENSLKQLPKRKNDKFPRRQLLWEPTGETKTLAEGNDFIFTTGEYREAIHRLSVILALNQGLVIEKVTFTWK